MKKVTATPLALISVLFALMFCSLSSGFPVAIMQLEQVLTVETDRQSYYTTEIVRISGMVRAFGGDPIPYSTISIQVNNPNNNTVFLDIVFSLPNGTYSDRFRLELHATIGEYVAYVTSSAAGYPIAANLTTFNVIGILGDINGDGKVDLKDVYRVALAYGSFPGHPKWDALCDLNQDLKVDLKDYFITAKNYGKW